MQSPICTKQKQCEWTGWFISYMTLAIDLASNLGHVFPRSNIEIAISTKHLTWSRKNKDGWILWMVWYFVNNIWPTVCFHRLLAAVPFRCDILPLATSVWLYLSQRRLCVFRTHYMLGAVLLFWASLHIHTDHVLYYVLCNKDTNMV